MKLITKAIALTVPSLYAQDGKRYEATAYVRLFNPSGDGTWYITEYSPEECLAFGLTYFLSMNDQLPRGELGYISITELQAYRSPFRLGIERDLSFKPTTLATCLEQYHGITLDRRSAHATKPSSQTTIF